MDIDLSQYMGMYIDGSKENLDMMDKQLLALEQDPSNIESIGEIFRAAHTLKGMSATMGFEKIAHLTHEMENILDELRNHKIQVVPEVIDLLFETFDVLRLLVNDSIEATDSNADIEGIIKKLNDVSAGRKIGSSAEITKVDISPSESAVENNSDASSSSTSDTLADELVDMTLNEFEWQVVFEAKERGAKIMLMVVTLIPDCLLKAPRAFMVVRNLEEIGFEVIKSVPETKDIEEEKFDLSFKMLILGNASENMVKDSIESISEIESVKVVSLKPEDFEKTVSETVKPVEQTIVEAKPESAPAKPTPSPTPSQPVAPVAQPPVVAAKPVAAPPPPTVKKAPPKKHRKERKSSQTVRVDMRRLDELMNLVGELVINRTRLADIGAAHKLKDLNETLGRVSQISSSLQSVVMQVRMVPIEQVFDRFPRMVRDLSKKLGKKINLVVEGKDTEMDRTVIDEIGDPMVHLIRNSIDHGIETPEERVSKGKPEAGTITLIARHEGNNVIIEVRDDGKGVDPSIIGRLAVERGLFTAEQISQMPPEEIIKIVFLAGFSTASVVSDLSGRGVGMDAVKAKLEDLNGVLDIESKVGQGSRVIIKLPLTLAILPALMVKVGPEMFAIPLGSVMETMDITKADINIVQHQEVTLLRGDVLPIISLRDVLDVPTTDEERKILEEKEDEISLVVCSSGEKRAGFMVDELLGQQEIVIKSLGSLLGGLTGIMGATMRGDGSIALILDVPSFFQKGKLLQ